MEIKAVLDEVAIRELIVAHVNQMMGLSLPIQRVQLSFRDEDPEVVEAKVSLVPEVFKSSQEVEEVPEISHEIMMAARHLQILVNTWTSNGYSGRADETVTDVINWLERGLSPFQLGALASEMRRFKLV